MDQKSEDNEISLGELVKKYKKERKECPEVGRHPSLLSRVTIGILFTLKHGFFKILNLLNIKELSVHREGILEHKNLLDQEFSFQDKMHKAIRGIIEDNELTDSQLKEYSHALKTLTKKYSRESTHYLLVVALIILIFAAVGKLLKITVPLLTDDTTILVVATFFFSLFALIARIFINETVPTYEELILLIDEYIDSPTE